MSRAIGPILRTGGHIYNQPPSSQVLPRSVRVAHTVKEGNIIKWEGFVIRVADTPGPHGWKRLIYAERQRDKLLFFRGSDIWCRGKYGTCTPFKKAAANYWNPRIKRSTGFWITTASWVTGRKLVSSLMKLIYERNDIIVPAHGEIIEDVKGAAALLIGRIDEIYLNYCAISSVNFYFP